MNYSTIPTVVGAAKLRNASLLGQKVDITRVAFGDGDGAEYEPTGQETALKKQVYECPPNRIEEEAGAPTWIELEAVIPHNVGGWYLREVGCFDDEGDLIFIGNIPSSFKPSGEAGVIKDLVFEMVYDAVAADVVQIKIDPNVVIATRKYVDDQDKAHTDAPNPHPQYATDESVSQAFQSHESADNPHSQYLKTDILVGLVVPDSTALANRSMAFIADGSSYLVADYPKLMSKVQGTAIMVDQALIDAEPEKYAACYGITPSGLSFTVPNYALRPHLAVAGSFGAVGSTVEDQIQNITGKVTNTGSTEGITFTAPSQGVSEGALKLEEQINANCGGNLSNVSSKTLSFDASLSARTGSYTEVNSSFLNFYIIHGEVA